MVESRTVNLPEGDRRGAAAVYVLAMAALGIAVLIRWLLDPLMGDALPLVTLFGAVAIAVWVGGPLPAAITALLGYVACSYLFIAPRGTLALQGAGQTVGLAA
jgi:K+-sensing histidine kinase KdpD